MDTDKNMDVDLPEENTNQQMDDQQETNNEFDEVLDQMNEYKQQLIRTRAEMDNQRKRMEREADNAKKFALQDFIAKLLPATDSMEKGLDISYMEEGIDGEVLFEGMQSTMNICKEVFKSVGVEEINPLGKDFDPELHEAMSIKHVKGKKPNIVLGVFQKGYLLNGRLIRPARVEVSASE